MLKRLAEQFFFHTQENTLACFHQMYVDMPESTAEKRRHGIHVSFYFRWTDRHVGLWITKQLCGVILGALITDHLEFGLLLIFCLGCHSLVSESLV